MPLRHNPVTLLESTCDGCKKDLRPFPNDPDLKDAANYAILSPCFGYGSRLDDLADWIRTDNAMHVCEDCWEKVLAVLELPAERNNNDTTRSEDQPRNTQSEERRAC